MPQTTIDRTWLTLSHRYLSCSYPMGYHGLPTPPASFYDHRGDQEPATIPPSVLYRGCTTQGLPLTHEPGFQSLFTPSSASESSSLLTYSFTMTPSESSSVPSSPPTSPPLSICDGLYAQDAESDVEISQRTYGHFMDLFSFRLFRSCPPS